MVSISEVKYLSVSSGNHISRAGKLSRRKYRNWFPLSLIMDIYRDLRSLNTPTIMTLEQNEDEFNRFPGGNCIFFFLLSIFHARSWLKETISRRKKNIREENHNAVCVPKHFKHIYALWLTESDRLFNHISLGCFPKKAQPKILDGKYSDFSSKILNGIEAVWLN